MIQQSRGRSHFETTNGPGWYVRLPIEEAMLVEGSTPRVRGWRVDMIQHSCGVANPGFRFLVGLFVGVVVTLTLLELSRKFAFAISYQIAKRYGRWWLAKGRRGGR